MNLAVLKKSRREPEVGDVFAMQPSDGQFLYGRVIATDANPLGVAGGILIYIYRSRSESKEAVPALLPQDLLIAPLITNRLPWSRGYFEHIRNEALRPEDRLPKHCFKNYYGKYFDEYGHPIGQGIEPCGEWGLGSYRTIDDEISQALGIPLAPEE